jgi:DNA adenine methylase
MTPSAVYTPLRYPGGKAKLGRFLADVVRVNCLVDGSYVEPYAGGAGAALFLLFRGFVSSVHLNDLDRPVAAFWRAVTGPRNEAFARAIETVPLTVKEWDHQRAIYVARVGRGFDLGFAMFYLNRTNRSGIMNGGIIGGRRQTGPWRIDARFSRADLAARVRMIGRMRHRISVSCADAMDLLDDVTRSRYRKSLVYLDPPYFKMGRELYRNFYGPEDHERIATRVKRLTLPWVLTYDDCRDIRRLYRGCRVYASEVSYSARDVRRGSEVVIIPRNLVLPPRPARPPRHLPGFTLR